MGVMPAIQPVHNPVFTTADSLEDVIFEAQIELMDGLVTQDRLRVLFGIYHNTLLKLAGSRPSN